MNRKWVISLVVLCSVADAIQSIKPGAQWSMNGDDYSDLVWIDATQSKPTRAQVVQALQDCVSARQERAAARAQAKAIATDGTKTQAERLAALIDYLDVK